MVCDELHLCDRRTAAPTALYTICVEATARPTTPLFGKTLNYSASIRVYAHALYIHVGAQFCVDAVIRALRCPRGNRISQHIADTGWIQSQSDRIGPM